MGVSFPVSSIVIRLRNYLENVGQELLKTKESQQFKERIMLKTLFVFFTITTILVLTGCTKNNFESPDAFGKAFFETLKDIDSEQDILILQKFIFSKEEYQEFIGKSNLSENNIESYNNMKDEFFKEFKSKILSNVLRIKDSNDLIALGYQISKTLSENKDAEYEKLKKEEKKLELKHFYDIMQNAEFLSFSLSYGLSMINNKTVIGNNDIPSYIKFQLEEKIYQIRITSLFKTRSGWKIYEL